MPRRGGRKDNSDPPPTPSSLGGNAAARLPPQGTGQRAAGTGHGPPLLAGLLHNCPLAVHRDLHIAYTSQLRAWPDTGPETLGQAQRPVPATGGPKHAGFSCTQADEGPSVSRVGTGDSGRLSGGRSVRGSGKALTWTQAGSSEGGGRMGEEAPAESEAEAHPSSRDPTSSRTSHRVPEQPYHSPSSATMKPPCFTTGSTVGHMWLLWRNDRM